MEIMKKIFSNVVEFIFSHKFREDQKWYDGIIDVLSIIPANGWTASRIIFAPLLTYFLFMGYMDKFYRLFAFLCLTDCVDGAVARKETGGLGTAFGKWFDGIADKIMMGFVYIPTLFIFWKVLILSAGIVIGKICLIIVEMILKIARVC